MCAINYDTWHVHLTHPIQALNNLTCLTTSQRYWQPHRIFSLHRNTECETGPIGWKRHNFRNCTYWHKRYVYICIHSYRHTHIYMYIHICVYIYRDLYLFLGGAQLLPSTKSSIRVELTMPSPEPSSGLPQRWSLSCSDLLAASRWGNTDPR